LTKKSHGGVRKGAGRKAQLAALVAGDVLKNGRLDIGSWCESQWLAEAQRGAEARFSHKILPSTLAEKQAALRKRAQSTRKRVHYSEYEKAGQSVFGKRPRLYHLEIRRPYGLKARIIRNAVKHAKAKYGQDVSERWVKRVWDEFRALERTLT